MIIESETDKKAECTNGADMTMITPYGVVVFVVVVVVVLTRYNEESTHTNASLLERMEDH